MSFRDALDKVGEALYLAGEASDELREHMNAAESLAQYLHEKELLDFREWVQHGNGIGTDAWVNEAHVFFDICTVLGLDPAKELKED